MFCRQEAPSDPLLLLHREILSFFSRILLLGARRLCQQSPVATLNYELSSRWYAFLTAAKQ